ncbi:hypothetical protein KIN20_016879 [Parelaphostrongylus tenuis]|uniref:Uncharacterized protein n=1 Tax=Parelaphostrongylus tenuis TaxID=148309 RepID=A0AAD5QQ73_PARTN|nr:hypothetical protein KIN20_016879 [Parelaphostrongylus tenuis]
MFAFLTQFMFTPLVTPEIKTHMEQNNQNLVNFVNRMKDAYWPDWEETMKNLSLDTKWKKRARVAQRSEMLCVAHVVDADPTLKADQAFYPFEDDELLPDWSGRIGSTDLTCQATERRIVTGGANNRSAIASRMVLDPGDLPDNAASPKSSITDNIETLLHSRSNSHYPSRILLPTSEEEQLLCTLVLNHCSPDEDRIAETLLMIKIYGKFVLACSKTGILFQVLLT